MKLITELEDRRIEEMFNGERCKQCQVPLGDGPHSMKPHSELPDYCEHCGEDMMPENNYDEAR